MNVKRDLSAIMMLMAGEEEVGVHAPLILPEVFIYHISCASTTPLISRFLLLLIE